MIAVDALGPDAAEKMLGDDWRERLGVAEGVELVDVQPALALDAERVPRIRRPRAKRAPAEKADTAPLFAY
jgi:hypothetical protein